MSAPISWADSTDERGRKSLVGTDQRMNRYAVHRHGAGRSEWVAVLPDGTSAIRTRQSDARLVCESWEPDSTLVQLDGTPQLGVRTALLSLEQETELTDDELHNALCDLGLHLGKEHKPDPRYGYGSTGNDQRANLKRIVGLTRLKRILEASIKENVDAARINTQAEWNSNAATWDEVGGALGVTKQSASSKFGVKKS